MVLLMLSSAARASGDGGARIVDLGDNTFSSTYEATTTFNRDVDKLAEMATHAAREFCAGKGREAKIVSITVDKPWMTLGIPKATVVFRALERGDPALSEPVPAAVVRKGMKGNKETERAVAAAAASNDDLYRALLNLDDLRKKGILTEEEFQAEKKKVLARSK
jgi:hypothetical protein